MTSSERPASIWWRWPAEPASAGAARHKVMAYLREQAVPEPPLNDVCLVVSELVTNVIRHAYNGRDRGEVRVGLDFAEQRLCLTVEDDGGGLVPRTTSPGLGLGLPITATVAEDVRTRSNPGGGTRIAVSFRADSPRP